MTNRLFQSPWTNPNTALRIPEDIQSWTFLAHGRTLSDGGLWWVYDRSMDDYATGYAQDLTSWTSSDAEVDSDHDGLPDWFENAVGLDPQKADTDGDGVADGIEVALGTNPFVDENLDSDGDGIPDVWEYMHGLNPFDRSDGSARPDGSAYTNFELYFRGPDGTRRELVITVTAPSGAVLLPASP